MAVNAHIAGITGPGDLQKALTDAQYIADEALSTVAYLALALGKPLLLEGAPGVGKTEAATLLNSQGVHWPEAFRRAIGVALKDHDDLTYMSERLAQVLPGEAA